MEEIDIKEFINYYKKYIIHIVVVCALLALVMLGYNVTVKKPVYTTSATIVLVKDETSNTDTINQNDLIVNGTYSHIIKSKLVLNQVLNNLKLSYTYNQLYNEVLVKPVDDTEILRITVTDKNPSVAADIANEVSEVFTKEVTKIYNLNNVSTIDKAVVPDEPSNKKLLRDLLLAILVGFVGTSGVIFVIYYFDDTLRNTDTIETDIDMPIVAKVFKDSSKKDLIIDKRPNSNTSEAIRTLRTNLQFSEVDSKLKTLLITSAVPGEGKSFISANLAISFAQSGKKVLLVDADMRKGRQHKIFRVSGRNGLSNLLISDIKKYKDYVLPTKIENLSLITRGVIPPNPSELLNSKKNASLLKLLAADYDVIILDGAPVTGLSDSLILSPMVDKVLIVASVNHTAKSIIRETKKALVNVGASIIGCVANNVSAKKKTYGSYYYYYGYGEKRGKK